MTQKENVSSSNGWNVVENEARLERARRAFEQGLRDASEKGALAARRLIVPMLWGGALLGGALLAFAVLRMARRQTPGLALLRVYIQPPEKAVNSRLLPTKSLLPALGGALARLAIQRILSPAPEQLLAHSGSDSSPPPSSSSGGLAHQPHPGNKPSSS
ncbi:MAG TPA: hypothetical protein VJU61_21685 [Polyangiaceae bacterium]|nr:hypothetical protein [Polyangiaceae bacterium]